MLFIKEAIEEGLFSQKNGPGINPKVAANGNHTDPTAEEWSWN
jgi:hypothetical protein